MKKTISLLLAILMIATAVPILGIVAAAEGASADTTTSYVVYTEDFEGLSVGGDSSDLLAALGWYVPEGEEDKTIASYTVTTGADGKGSALRISTIAPKGLENDSLVTVFGGDVMALVRKADYTISYDLTYRVGTTNTKGFSTLIYNYNEQGGVYVGHEGEGAAYGYAPVRVCGTGFNNVYYPVSGGSTDCVVEAQPNAGEYVMSNGYNRLGSYSTLYSKIAATLGDTEYTEAVVTGAESTLINKTLKIRIEVDYEMGPSVYINDVLVSVPDTEYYYLKNSGNAVWSDFVTRTDGSSIGLLTKHNVVADIDNIVVESASLMTETATELPELVITELSPMGYDKNNTWAEFIEVYNTSDRYINLAEYSLMFCDVTAGSADDVVAGNNHKKFAGYVNLSTILGQPLKSSGNYYLTESELYVLGENRYEYVDDNRYSLVGTTYQIDPKGNNRRIKYVERWNERYNDSDIANVEDNYDNSTYLAPGECVLFYTMIAGTESYWQHGVNGSGTTKSISQDHNGDNSFRSIYQSRGLSEDTKVVAFSNFNLADLNSNGAGQSRRYYIGKASDAEGNAIAYNNVYVNDADYNDYIVSYVDWNSPLITGKTAETAAPGLSAFGQVGVGSYGYSGVWVYGVDGSGDSRRGTLYVANNPVTHWQRSHVGKLAGYQQILMGDMYAKNDGEAAELSITEIVPRTNDLVGLDNSAFTAMELTNTSKGVLNLYNYALVRTALGVECYAGQGFTRSVELRAGNPVDKGQHNGAYYYFIEEHISNPETCYLQPGESVVIWFLSGETYATYNGDADFGFDYFREYWVKNGSPELAKKNAEGVYSTKVIAVDGCESETYNADYASLVFSPSPTLAAVYGVAVGTQRVKEGIIGTQDVLSVASLGISACYYDLQWSTFVEEGVTYYVNRLEYTTMPANQGMRYIAGGAGSSKCSAMVDSMKVQYSEFTTGGDHVWYTTEEGKLPVLVVRTNNALKQPKLGTLNGVEVAAITDHLFVSEEDEDGNIIYRYFDSLRADVLTLQGAALETAEDNPRLRFDTVVPASTYSSMAAVYGQSGFKVGTLIVETSQVEDMGVFTKADLDNAGIAYTDVESKIMYRTTDFAVLGASFEVIGDYNTSYTAVSYMEITLADGTVKSFCSTATTARSVIEVAESAWDDTEDEESAIYCHETIDGEYSRYNSDVQDKLRSYLGL